MGKKFTALVLQGGGALGAYEYGVVRALYENNNFKPDIITGVSIGAFSAATLAAPKGDLTPVEALGKLWDLFTIRDNPFLNDDIEWFMSMANNPGMYTLRPSYYTTYTRTHNVNPAPLYDSLDSVIDFDKLNSKDAPQVVITATNVETGRLREFDNTDRKAPIEAKHIVASGSMPPYFPWVDIDGSQYWDGALYSNTPLKPAIKRLKALGGSSDERQLVLVKLHPPGAPLPQNMYDVLDRKHDLPLACKMECDQHHCAEVNAQVEMMDLIKQSDPSGELIEKIRTKTPGLIEKLINYKKINIVSVTYSGDEPYRSEANFTENKLKDRIEQGYRDGSGITID